MNDQGMPERASLPWEISVSEIRARLAAGEESVRLIDCREAEEVATGTVSKSEWIPMSDFTARFAAASVAPDEPIVVFCHLGQRSLQVVQWLRQQGFARAQSMAGGMEAWSNPPGSRPPPV